MHPRPYVLYPSSLRWRCETADDPDFELEYEVPPGTRLCLRFALPLTLAQRLVQKPPLVSLEPEPDGRVRLRVVLGLTGLHRGLRPRLNPRAWRWIERRLAALVTTVVLAKAEGTSLRMASYGTLHLNIPLEQELLCVQDPSRFRDPG